MSKRNNKKVNKKLIKLAKQLGYEKTEVGTHGTVWVHPAAIDTYTGRPSRVSIGGSSSDINFHRQTVRDFRHAGFDVKQFN